MAADAPTLVVAALGLALLACGDDAAAPDAGGAEPCDDPPGPFATGDADGHAEPLGAAAGQARAGRLEASELPAAASDLLTWAAGDFVLANDRIAIVIEDVGESDLYDPWGGRPVGIARVVAGALVEPGLFGEQLFMAGRSTIVTTSVTVLNDGSDGEAAVIRATGRLAPLPFLDNLLSALYFDDLTDVEAAIDYTLAPDAETLDVTMRFGSPRTVDLDTGALLHGFMYTERLPTAVPGAGFTAQLNNAEWAELIDDHATSYAYRAADGELGSSLAQSGFVGAFTPAFEIARCGVTDHPHATILIGGPGIDGLEAARSRVDGITQREITGTVGDGTAMLAGFRVHAVDSDGDYLTRVTTDNTGAFALHVPASADVTLTAYRRGWAPATTDVAAAATTATITVAPSVPVQITILDGTPTEIPARVQLLPAGSSTIPTVPEEFGERTPTSGRLHVEYATGAPVTVAVPPGDWRLVVSRGYEYDLVDQTITVVAGTPQNLTSDLTRVVDTTGVQCGDFHIHTHRSNDSGDDASEKLRSAVADGLELPVRTDHEWVNSFQGLITELGLSAWAFGIGSVEMTSFQIWGHMNVFPLVEDATRPNRGTPTWQTWPTATSPDARVTTLSPRAVFETVRARDEAPAIIINHPRGGSEYFNYVGLDAAANTVTRPDDWDEEFKLIEVFNDQTWLAARNGVVADWFGLLNAGRTVFAVGSSDSHSIRSSPVGYPRTCIELGTDTPSAVVANDVRDQLSAGHAFISGGIYLDAHVGAAGPGDTATGTGATTQVDLRVQAAAWIDVDSIDVVVDGVTVQTIAILPGDAGAGAIRWEDQIDVDVAAAGSWVVLAAYGDASLEPVHPGRIPFGVTQPIFLER